MVSERRRGVRESELTAAVSTVFTRGRVQFTRYSQNILIKLFR